MGSFNLTTLSTLINLTLAAATPLLLTALGGLFSERAGVVNVGLEGIMTFGAFAAVAATIATSNPWLGLVSAIIAGMVIAALHALVSISFRANQVVSGTAINILAAGLTAFLLTKFYGHGGESPPIPVRLPTLNIPLIKDIPFLGPILGQQMVGVYLAFVALAITHYVVYRTPLGLRIRAVGEHPRAADTMGVNVFAVRYLCVILSGALAGLAGGILSTGNTRTFVEGMVAGRGFIALAAVIFGNWRPLGAMWACLLFGGADALQMLAQINNWNFVIIPRGLLVIVPYVLTMLALAGLVGRSTPPAASGVPYQKSGK